MTAPLQAVTHSPGPAWVAGASFREQPGVDAHLATMSGWLADGRLLMGGPFLDDEGGGQAITRFGSVEDAQAAADADPAVRSGLLVGRARPWLAGLVAEDWPHA